MSYPGGKGGVFHKLINLMPPHMRFTLKTHLGGGAIMRSKRRTMMRNIGIEIDSDVIDLWTKTKIYLIILLTYFNMSE